jgi:putative ABC transport system ATP-binding protein
MAEPTVLLADEPTASLDPLSPPTSRRSSPKRRTPGLATVIVTHDHAPLGHADRHLHLAAGELTTLVSVAS